jgi:hypothetical protein
MTDLFDGGDPADDAPAPKFEDLVGEGKKYKDNDAAAKAIAEKDRFIEQLKGELKGIRTELQTRLTLEQAIDKLTVQAPPPSPSRDGTPPSEPDHQAQPAITPEAISEIVTKTMTESEKKKTRASNIAFVEQKLQEAFGPNFKRTITEQAGKLGIDKDWAMQVAADQPQAFLRMFDVSPQPQSNAAAVTAPRSSVASDAFNFRPNMGEKRMSHYEQIRRTDPAKYWSPAIQNEIHREAQKQGEAFFDS